MHPIYQSQEMCEFLPDDFRHVVAFLSKKANTAFCVVNKDDILFVLDDDGCILECLYVQCCFSLQSSLFLFVEPMSFLKQERMKRIIGDGLIVSSCEVFPSSAIASFVMGLA